MDIALDDLLAVTELSFYDPLSATNDIWIRDARRFERASPRSCESILVDLREAE